MFSVKNDITITPKICFQSAKKLASHMKCQIFALLICSMPFKSRHNPLYHFIKFHPVSNNISIDKHDDPSLGSDVFITQSNIYDGAFNLFQEAKSVRYFANNNSLIFIQLKVT